MHYSVIPINAHHTNMLSSVLTMRMHSEHAWRHVLSNVGRHSHHHWWWRVGGGLVGSGKHALGKRHQTRCTVTHSSVALIRHFVLSDFQTASRKKHQERNVFPGHLSYAM